MEHITQITARLGDFDALLLTSEANCFYAVGFLGEGAALITREGAWYFTDSRYTEAAEKAVRTARVEEVSRSRPLSTWIREILGEGERTVAVEEDAMTVAALAQYEEKFPCRLVPGASALLHELRAVKDPEELEILIAAQRIAEGALERILPELREGVSEQEIAARLQYHMLSLGARRMSFDPIVASGPNGSMPHAVPTARTLRRGEFITMDFGCVCGGYCSDMTRTVCLGQPTEEMARVYDTVLRAQQAGIAAAKAGVTGAAIHGAAQKVIEDAGYGAYFGHGFGHSVGIEIHESPNAAPGNDKPMPAGAVISAEPGIYLPGRFGVRIEDVLVLEPEGCRDITVAGKELLIL